MLLDDQMQMKHRQIFRRRSEEVGKVSALCPQYHFGQDPMIP